MCPQGMGGDDVIDLETFIENHERDSERWKMLGVGIVLLLGVSSSLSREPVGSGRVRRLFVKLDTLSSNSDRQVRRFTVYSTHHSRNLSCKTDSLLTIVTGRSGVCQPEHMIWASPFCDMWLG